MRVEEEVVLGIEQTSLKVNVWRFQLWKNTWGVFLLQCLVNCILQGVFIRVKNIAVQHYCT